jgi:hypothetical protein
LRPWSWIQPRSAYSTASLESTGGVSSSGRLHRVSVIPAWAGRRFGSGLRCHHDQVSRAAPTTIRIPFQGAGTALPKAFTTGFGQPRAAVE